MYDRSGLTHQQRVFVEGLLRSLETGTYLSEHVASAKSVVLTLTRAHHALDGHARLNQPTMALSRTLLTRALNDVISGVTAFNTTPEGAAFIAMASQALNQADAIFNANPSTADKQQVVRQIGSLVQPAVLAVNSLFEALWNGAHLSKEVAGRIRSEVAVLVVLKGRDGLALRVELFQLLGQGMASATDVADVLFPVPKQYRVAMVVSGTRVLDGLNRFLPTAQQWPLVGPQPPAGVTNRKILNLISPALANGGSGALIMLPASASDVWTAISTARRQVVETLDQYAAGQRLLELTLGQRSVAVASFMEPFTSDPQVGGIEVASPLTDHWPTPLRSSLRMANLAGQVDAPVASVMLSWSAIESLGVKSSDIQMIAKGCALQSLRQQILSVYKSVTDSANARLRLGRWRVERTRRLLGKAERGYARAVRHDSAEAQDSAARLQRSVARRQYQLAAAELSCMQIEQNLLPNMEIIRQNLLAGGDPANPLNLSSWLLELNDFLDAILPLDTISSEIANQIQNAIKALAQEAGGLAAEQLATWQGRLANPATLADWLNSQEDMFHGMLAWMYVSRNLAIHTGQFSVPADELTAKAGRGIADMLLEFLGHWYQLQHSRGMPDIEAKDILVELADRKDTLESNMRNSQSCYPLNVSSITEPDHDCWNRVR